MTNWSHRERQDVREEESIAAMAEKLLRAELGDTGQMRFHARHIERCQPDWADRAAREFRSIIEQNVNNLKEDPALEDVVAPLETIAAREPSAFNYLAGLSLPRPHPVENLEDGLNLILFSRRSHAAFAKLQEKIGGEMDAIICHAVPDHPSAVPRWAAEMENVEEIAARNIRLFLEALQRLAKPPEESAPDEYAAAKNTVLQFTKVRMSLQEAIRFPNRQIGAAMVNYAMTARETLPYPANEQLEATLEKYMEESPSGRRDVPPRNTEGLMKDLLKQHFWDDAWLKAYFARVEWNVSHDDFLMGVGKALKPLLSVLRGPSPSSPGQG